MPNGRDRYETIIMVGNQVLPYDIIVRWDAMYIKSMLCLPCPSMNFPLREETRGPNLSSALPRQYLLFSKREITLTIWLPQRSCGESSNIRNADFLLSGSQSPRKIRKNRDHELGVGRHESRWLQMKFIYGKALFRSKEWADPLCRECCIICNPPVQRLYVWCCYSWQRQSNLEGAGSRIRWYRDNTLLSIIILW